MVEVYCYQIHVLSDLVMLVFLGNRIYILLDTLCTDDGSLFQLIFIHGLILIQPLTSPVSEFLVRRVSSR